MGRNKTIKAPAQPSSTANNLTGDEYIAKLERLFSEAVETANWPRAKSLKLKLDNAFCTSTRRGGLGDIYTEWNNQKQKAYIAKCAEERSYRKEEKRSRTNPSTPAEEVVLEAIV